jgi:predicted Zn-dependent protease
MTVSRFLIAAFLVLAGCDVADAPLGGSTCGRISTPSPEQAIGSSERAMARAFVGVIDRLEPVAECECRRRAPDLNCDFLIVVDDAAGRPANAFQTVDETGRPVIAFTISLIADAKNTDEIAFVMAHEAAHHIERHLEQQRRIATIGAVVFGRLANETGFSAERVRSAQELGAAVGARTYSKDFELEADRLGTIIAARAGYSPVRGAEFFFRVPDPGDRFLATHPPNAERVDMVLRTAEGL